MNPLDGLNQEMMRESESLHRLFEVLPEDKLDWKPHEKSMTLGELCHHLATIPKQVSDMARLDEFEFPKEKCWPTASSRAELLQLLNESLEHASKNLGEIKAESLGDTWSAVAEGKVIVQFPRGAVLRIIMLNHWYHHRGQLTVYLRMLDTPLPSVYGPSADDNPFAK